jgi:hypothetical protein
MPFLLGYPRRLGTHTTTMRGLRPWVREALPIAALAVLATVKLWPIVTPFVGSRLYLGGDFGLAIEPYFYHQLKRGILPLWDPTLGTGLAVPRQRHAPPDVPAGASAPVLSDQSARTGSPRARTADPARRPAVSPSAALRNGGRVHVSLRAAARAGAIRRRRQRHRVHALGLHARPRDPLDDDRHGGVAARDPRLPGAGGRDAAPSLGRACGARARRGVPRRPSTALLSRRPGNRGTRRHADRAPRGGGRPLDEARGNPAAGAADRARGRGRAAPPHLGDGRRVAPRRGSATTGSPAAPFLRSFWPRRSCPGGSSPSAPGAAAPPSSTSTPASCP